MCVGTWLPYLSVQQACLVPTVDPLGLKVQLVVSPVWVLGVEPGFPGRAASAPSCRASSPD